jgi:hypothetical protein
VEPDLPGVEFEASGRIAPEIRTMRLKFVEISSNSGDHEVMAVAAGLNLH